MQFGRGGLGRSASLLLALLPLLGGCSDELPSTAPGGVTAAVSESIATVVNVSWTTPTPTIGYVSYGTTPSLDQATPIGTLPTVDHVQAVLGLSADATYYYQVITWDIANATAGRSDVKSFHTGALPAGAPVLTVESFPVNGADGKPEAAMATYVLVPFVGASATTIGLVDPAGTLVWYHAESSGRAVTRARLSNDRKRVIYGAIASDPKDSEIVEVALDGSVVTSHAAAGLGQDFAVIDQRGFAILAPDSRDSNGSTYVGDQIVEIADDGTRHTAFSTWDCFDPTTSPGDGKNGVWTGASALQVESDASAYYVALRNLNSIVKVDRKTGKCVWILGDTAQSSLTYADQSVPFQHPGSFYADDGKLVVLDADGGANGSRMADYDLDQDKHTATQVKSYEPSPSIQVKAFGEATLIYGEDKLVNFANGSRLEVVDSLGQLKWRLRVQSGEGLGYQTPFRNLYAPLLAGNFYNPKNETKP